jgi:hypothetical protein
MAAYLARNVRQAAHVVSIDHNGQTNRATAWLVSAAALTVCRLRSACVCYSDWRLKKAANNGCDVINFDHQDVVKTLKEKMPPGPSVSCSSRDVAVALSLSADADGGLLLSLWLAACSRASTAWASASPSPSCPGWS